ncbi:MAG: rhomboid family intramembrane serine protease, partial [Candidatus Binatia bacterium]
MDGGNASLVRSTPERPRADEWMLALASAGIEARLDWSPQGGYALVVHEAEAGRAGAVLDAYEEENRVAPPAPPPPEWGPTYGAITAAVVLCVFFVVTGPRSPDSIWFDRGGSNAARLGDGEWWRAVTALTLHADFPHVLGNAVVLLIFGTSLCALVGPGAGLWLMLLAGAGGNLLN